MSSSSMYLDRATRPLVILPLSQTDWKIAINDCIRVICLLFVQCLLSSAGANDYSILVSEEFLQTILGSILGIITYHTVAIHVVRAL